MEMKLEDIGLGRPPSMKNALNIATIEENSCPTNAILVVEKQHKDGKILDMESRLVLNCSV